MGDESNGVIPTPPPGQIGVKMVEEFRTEHTRKYTFAVPRGMTVPQVLKVIGTPRPGPGFKRVYDHFTAEDDGTALSFTVKDIEVRGRVTQAAEPIPAAVESPAGDTGVIVGMVGTDTRLWIKAADFEAAKAATLEYAERVRGARGLFRNCLTSATFVVIGEGGRLVGPGQPIDLLALGAIKAA